jgi:multicomponent Na+:H+ antiporter subunit B
MNSLILQTATRFLFPLLLLFAVFVLLRGHNEPGGGFAGGLVAASAYALYALAFGVPATRAVLTVDPRGLIGIGLLIAVASALASLPLGLPLMTHQAMWGELTLPGLGKLAIGSPLFFDLGVFLVVVGMALTIILPLAEE